MSTGWFEAFYDTYPRIEEDFLAALDVGLAPRGPELLYDIVRGLSLPVGSLAVDVGWGEWAAEQSGDRHLVRASQLLRDPARYVARFGQTAYGIMLGDCLWHIYGMIGKLSPAVYVLSTGSPI